MCCTNVTLMLPLRYVTSLCIIWVDLRWGPLYYTQVIRWGQVSTYESKTKIYFRVRQNVTEGGTLSGNVQTNATANIVTNVPQLQEKTTKYLNFLYLVINDL
jgi:hypothetical protein